MDDIETRIVVAMAALALGVALGAVGQASRFCLRGGVEDALRDRAAPRLRAFAIAMGVGLLATQALVWKYGLDLSETTQASAPLSLAGLVVGGGLFGVGMALAGGCGGRLFVLAAAGNLRSVFTLLVFGLTAYASMRGILAPLREAVQGVGVTEAGHLGLAEASLGGVAAALTGLEGAKAGLAGALTLGAVLLAWAFARAPGLGHVAGGVAMGALVAGGWAVTGVLGLDDFDPTPLESLAFTAPTGDSLVYLLTYTGASVDFGIALVGGVVMGAFAMAAARGELRLIGFEGGPREMLRYGAGGALMGFGGVTALGCSFGQGLSGVSTGALGSLIALGAIVLGAAATMGLRAHRRGPKALAAA